MIARVETLEFMSLDALNASSNKLIRQGWQLRGDVIITYNSMYDKKFYQTFIKEGVTQRETIK